MANTRLSSRNTSWERIILSPGFRRGFYDVRMGRPWPSRELGVRNADFNWWYEDGRLFAASEYSQKWDVMPTSRRYVTSELIEALVKAQDSGVWPT